MKKTNNEDKELRRDIEKRKIQIGWEGYRRSREFLSRYKKYPALYLFPPERKATDIPAYELEVFFKQYAIGMNISQMRKANESPKRFVELIMSIDMAKSPTAISGEFKRFIESVKRVRKKRNLDNHLIKVPPGRHKLHGFFVEDFEIYDDIIKIRTRNKRKTCRQCCNIYARRNLEQRYAKSKNKPKSFDVDAETKKILNAFNKAKWVINGGYRAIVETI